MAKLKLTNVRLSFPDLFTARPFKQGDKPKFKATFLMEKGSAMEKAVQAEIMRVATEKWGAKAKAIVDGIRGNPNKFCFQDGDTKSYAGYEGMMALTAGNVIRPTVLDQLKNPLTEEDGKPYAGCYVDAVIEFFTYNNSGNGISASLGGVQFRRDGDAFAGGAVATDDDFDTLEEGAEADDLA